MKNCLLLFLVFVGIQNSKLNAQTNQNLEEIHTNKPIMNTIYFEMFGQGLAGSLNYDCMFRLDKRWKNSFSVGAVYVPKSLGFGDGLYIGLPVSYNWLIGGKRNFLELGVGLTTQLIGIHSYNPSVLPTKDQAFFTYLTPKLGYRFQAMNSGLFFRATLTPHLALVNTTISNRNETLSTSSKFFENVLNLDYPAFPWVGMSIGYTFKTVLK